MRLWKGNGAFSAKKLTPVPNLLKDIVDEPAQLGGLFFAVKVGRFVLALSNRPIKNSGFIVSGFERLASSFAGLTRHQNTLYSFKRWPVRFAPVAVVPLCHQLRTGSYLPYPCCSLSRPALSVSPCILSRGQASLLTTPAYHRVVENRLINPAARLPPGRFPVYNLMKSFKKSRQHFSHRGKQSY